MQDSRLIHYKKVMSLWSALPATRCETWLLSAIRCSVAHESGADA